ncbi:MAG: hypothetical protein ACREIY_05355 [Candidatus Rokuibacteriota bacterium]
MTEVLKSLVVYYLVIHGVPVSGNLDIGALASMALTGVLARLGLTR